MNPPPAQRLRINRRRLLQFGGLGSLGMGLSNLVALRQAHAATAPPRPIEACIFLFYYGGPSHHDTFDMKLDAPREVRGDFAPISTSVPGLPVCEHLPNVARLMDRMAIVRSLHHPMRNHNSAAVESLCGRTPLRGDLELLANDPATDFPCMGAALTRMCGREQLVPPYVALPHIMYNVVMLPGQTAGFLGPSFEPLRILRDPNQTPFQVPELQLPAGMTAGDLSERERLLELVDAQTAAASEAPKVDQYWRRAFDVLQSDAMRKALDLDSEPAAVRDRYGRNTHGQSVLLARRLVENGVRFVSVYDKVHNGLNNWDTHVNNFGRLKDELLPPCDLAFSALVEDLEARGLLDTTLVVWIGEFGRTPRINSSGGRDHWPDCFSTVLAGGGVRGGALHGASDRLGAYPERDPATPGDLTATIFWRFGIDPHAEISDSLGRAYRLAEGEPWRGLFGA
ncbi:MAG: DUF1501 domain-containing protein [Pirellulales bacterium]|nr:DUF1501 domain-containing protein [Pirellulales bacterium]